MLKSYIYKVYHGTTYLGMLPKPKSEFAFPMEINSAGSMITVDVPLSVDTSNQEPPYLVAEDSSTFLMAEDGVTYLTAERAADAIGDSNNNILIRNGNKVKVYEYSDYWPNGKLMFSGSIQHIEAEFGDGVDDVVTIFIYSDGQDLSNYVIPGSTGVFADQSQLTINDAFPLSEPGGGTFPPFTVRVGQLFTVGVGVTNVSAIDVSLLSNSASYPQTFTLNFYDSLATAVAGGSPLASATASQPATSTTVTKFTFAVPVTVTAGAQYFFVISCSNNYFFGGGGGDGGGGISYNNADGYAGGEAYYYQVNGSGTDLGWNALTGPSSIYFKTYYSNLTTESVFTAQDPSTMLQTIVDSYSSAGGLVDYSTGTVDLTGLSVPYTFSLATTLEGIQVAKDLAPSTFYWYVDLGTNILYFKRVSTTADFTIIKGRHIDRLKLVSSIENVKNKAFLSGGDTGSGLNLFKTYDDQTSINSYGVRLDRISNNRVTTDAPADAIGDSFIAANKDQQYQTTVVIMANTMDITLFKPGKTIGFRGFGTFVDALIIQIVRIDYQPDQVTLTLGALPPRTSTAIEQALADINALQTIDNPTTPS